jgi:2-amino-4-hydroxy-6-hydroxymethyldihydropteridine diphosphokinase
MRRRGEGERQQRKESGAKQGTELYSAGLRVKPMARVFVGLGSNLGDREQTLNRAVEALRTLPGTSVRAVSAFRDTAPVGEILDQPRFLNGAVELETSLAARQLLDALLEIERSFGRNRTGAPPGGPRTLDLDLLLYGEAEIDEDGLAVPHPRLAERAFVLEPLAELDPALEVPGKGRVEALLAKLDSGS